MTIQQPTSLEPHQRSAPDREYEVALSFAGEDRRYVEMVAEFLTAAGITVFYDRYETADLWGKDLYTHLSDVYQRKARYMLMFVSADYAKKLWTTHERKSGQARAFQDADEYILPARFDDTEIPGLLSTTGYIDLRHHSPAEVAILVAKKLRPHSGALKASQVPSPKSPAVSGRAAFDYSKYDGRYRIGSALNEFETQWSRRDGASIYCYNDSPSVSSVALAPYGAAVQSVTDGDSLDSTSRVVSANVGQTVVLRNSHGIYEAIRIDGVKNIQPTADSAAELKITYWILVDGGRDFSDVVEPA